MKTIRIVIAILFFTLAQVHVHACDWPAPYNSNGYGWATNESACVATVSVSGWDGCQGTLNVVTDPIQWDPVYCNSPYFPYQGCGWNPVQWEIPIEINSTNLSVNGKVWTADSSTTLYTFNISASSSNFASPTQGSISAYLGYVFGPDAPSAPVTIMPHCSPRKCSLSGPCSCQSGQGPSGGAGCGQPINLVTGNTYITQKDVKRLPGIGPGLMLERTWNSLWPSDEPDTTVGLFGSHWRSTYEESVHLASDGMMEYSASDGSFTYFALSNGVWTAAVPLNPTTVLTPGNSYWTLTFGNGETRYFSNTSGGLIAIQDRNGLQTQIAYDALGRLSMVTDSASRHLYFAYSSNASTLVSAVTSDFGVSLSYAYDSQGRLTTVTNPDRSTENFEYNDPNQSYLITAVTDSQGKILEAHTYDSSGRGMTSSRANGVESLSISYSN